VRVVHLEWQIGEKEEVDTIRGAIPKRVQGVVLGIKTKGSDAIGGDKLREYERCQLTSLWRGYLI
jgi:hypothetical protein